MKMGIDITDALAALRSGGVVAMPTETVYGLAADARRGDAVSRIFALKGRPSTNPLIVHVASVEIANRYAVLDERARALFAAFSPGPLTIVLPSRGEISPLVTAGLSTVGIRIPDHALALQLLNAFDGPLAAPSANRSNHVSPTSAAHVRFEFGEAVPVLDGGACRVGIESTVLSLATDRPTILRPGAVSREAIERVIGPIESFEGHLDASIAAASPGQQLKHYAPRAPAYRCDGPTLKSLQRNSHAVLRIETDPAAAARTFYALLRDLDASQPPFILIEMPPDEPKWTALRDRITRATLPWSAYDGSARPAAWM